MKILAIETSCDETSVALVEKTQNTSCQVLSHVVVSSLDLHKKTGGVVPEVAAREQLASILPVFKEALRQSSLSVDQIDAIAVTQGPGLIGSLLVGVETAKALALAWKKPLIPVNHLLGHLLVNWLDTDHLPQFPALGLVVSGGHTDFIWFTSLSDFQWIGGTRDDAVGECFDKCARIIFNASYPGGPVISRQASLILEAPRPILPRPMLGDGTLELSFSGLKTAVLRAVQSGAYESAVLKQKLACDLERAIVEVLIDKIQFAVSTLNPTSLVVGGGVLANTLFRQELDLLKQSHKASFSLHYPLLSYCGDNAVMIGVAGLLLATPINPLALRPDPGLSF